MVHGDLSIKGVFTLMLLSSLKRYLLYQPLLSSRDELDRGANEFPRH